MRSDVTTDTQGERSQNGRAKAAVSPRDSFSDPDTRFSAHQDKRSTGGGVDSLLRANAALVHEIE